MMDSPGFWYAFGRMMYKYFHFLEWCYNSLSPNKIFIAILFICFAWWMLWQNKFNKKAIENGGYK